MCVSYGGRVPWVLLSDDVESIVRDGAVGLLHSQEKLVRYPAIDIALWWPRQLCHFNQQLRKNSRVVAVEFKDKFHVEASVFKEFGA